MNVSDLLASSSIPGTELPRRGLFVGRAGFLPAFSKAAALPRVEAALFSAADLSSLFRATQAGWTLYLIGNEEPVAQGTLAEETWRVFEAELLAFLAGQGIPVKRDYACLDHPRGRGKHRRDSVFLFPNTGALYHAAQEDGTELRESWVVARRSSELAAGWRAGCRTAGVGVCAETGPGALHVEPEVAGQSLAETLSRILAADAYARR
jgi:histidinol phosphatase-like enzyme